MVIQHVGSSQGSPVLFVAFNTFELNQLGHEFLGVFRFLDYNIELDERGMMVKNDAGESKFKRNKTLIMGIGNLLMGDEGAGIHIIRQLEKNKELADIEILDGGTGGIQLLDYFLEHDLVILVDATLDQQETGTITRLEPNYSGDYPKTILVHDLGLKEILDALHLLDRRPEIVLFTISIAKLDKISLSLSPEIQSVIPQVEEKIKTYLESITE